jgi:lysophospholipase L1-like esterase
VLAIPIFRLFARARGRLLTFHLIILNGLVSLVSGAAYAYQYVTGAYYPIVDAEMQRNEEAFMSSVTVKTINEIRAAYHRRPGKNVCRILFLGTSQTWGAGVARPDDTFVCLFESLLNRAAPKNCSFECVNGGIAAADAAWLLAVYERFWISLSPRTVFIILANNDRNAQRFAVTIDQMIAISLAAGIQPILVLEPNSIEADCRSLAFKHAVMTAIGKTRQVPVIDMQRYLSEKADEGFVWWDSVHLTSFGHRLAAQKLYTEFLRQFHGACPQPE